MSETEDAQQPITRSTAARVGISRRTVTKAAAWSVPVIAVATAVPLAAASVAVPTLEFINGPYALDGCSVLNNVTVRATTDGTTPAVGTAVTVALPSGLSWDDGTTGTKTLVTDASGEIVLPPIVGSAAASTATISVVGNSLTATESVTISEAVRNTVSLHSGPAQTPNGLAVVDLQARFNANTNVAEVHVLTSDGTAYTVNPVTGVWSPMAVPAGTTHMAITDYYGSISTTNGSWGRFYATGNSVTWLNGPAVQTPNGLPVADMVARFNPSTNAAEIHVLTSDGSAYVLNATTGVWSTAGGTPSGATFIAVTDNLAANSPATGSWGRFYAAGNQVTQIGGALVTTPNGLDVTDMAARYNTATGFAEIHVLTADGTAYVLNPVSGSWTQLAVPANATQLALTDALPENSPAQGSWGRYYASASC